MNDKNENLIDCSTCLFSMKIPVAGPDGELIIGQTQLVCKHSPPQVIVVQVPAPNGMMTSIRSLFPIVSSELCCHQHEEDPENFDLISGVRLMEAANDN
jgi:hypothetical protein